MKVVTVLVFSLLVSKSYAQLLPGDEEGTTAALSTALSSSSFYYNPSTVSLLSTGRRLSASGSSFAKKDFKSNTGFDHSKDAGFEFRPGYITGSRTMDTQAFGFFLVNTASFALPLDFSGSDATSSAQASGFSRVEGQDLGAAYAFKFSPELALGANLFIRDIKRNSQLLIGGTSTGPTNFTAYSTTTERQKWIFTRLGGVHQIESLRLGATLELPLGSIQSEKSVLARSQNGNTLIVDQQTKTVSYRRQPWTVTAGAAWPLSESTLLSADSQYQSGLSYDDENNASILDPEVKTISLGITSKRSESYELLAGIFYSNSSTMDGEYLSIGLRKKEDTSNWLLSPFYYRNRPKDSNQVQLTAIGVNFSTSLTY